MTAPDLNVIVKSPLDGYVYKSVAHTSSSDNVIVPQQNLMRVDGLNGQALEALTTPTYLTQDDMRFAAPRYYSSRETDVIAQAVAERREFQEPILPLD